ncbi:MAG: hypothetical protein ACR2O3_08860 [Rhizobiaceae bacterium]
MYDATLRSLWYDSWWLQTYIQVRDYLEANEPEKLRSFEKLIAPLRTDQSFKTTQFRSVILPERILEIKEVIQSLGFDRLNASEFYSFGRHILRNHSYFDKLQIDLLPLVEEYVGESVEPSYNFLSLYNNLGSCSAHMDSPQSKWTLDICIDQSDTWPISFSEVVDWPIDIARDPEGIAFREVLDNSEFTQYLMMPGDGLIFSGSSQWHFRDPIPKVGPDNFCQLVFLHYLPKGSAKAYDTREWGAYLRSSNVDNIASKMRNLVKNQHSEKGPA